MGSSRIVIASEAKQSSSPPHSLLDCFVANTPRNDGGEFHPETLRDVIAGLDRAIHLFEKGWMRGS
jgi:hypothetical protein